MLTRRVETLKEGLFTRPGYICLERARWITRYYKSNSNKYPPVIHRAKAVGFALNNIPTIIYPRELIVGSMTERRMGALLFPEFSSLALWPELRELHLRKDNAFVVKPEDLKELDKEIFPFWLGKTIGDYAISLLMNKRVSGRVGFNTGRIAIGMVKRIHPSLRRVLFEALVKGVYPRMKRYIGFKPFRLFAFEGVYMLTEFAGISHVTPDYKKLVERGFGWIRDRADRELKRAKDTDEIQFLDAVKIAANGVVEFAERYAKEAESLAREEKDGKRKRELLKIAEHLKNSPRNPARSFHEALQAVWITQVAIHHENYEQAISLGRIDQYLYPLYKNDIEKGIITSDEAKELLQCLWIKMSEFQMAFPALFYQYFTGLMNTQGACVGGINEKGEEATNELSYLILESIREVNTPQPNLFARIHKDTPSEFLKLIGRNISSGCPHPSVYNDEVIIRAMRKVGANLRDARDYAPLGCVEPNPQGRSFGSTDAALLNLGLCLELALNNGYSPVLKEWIGPETGRAEDFRSMEDVINAFQAQVAYIVKQMARGTNLISTAHAQYYPSPLLSSLIDDTIKKKRDVTSGGARYNFTGVQGVGVADVADSLSSIDTVVFKKKMVSMRKLLLALKDNYKGYTDLREFITNKVPVYGDDEGPAEGYANDVVRIYSEEVKSHRNPRGGQYIPGFYSVTTHIPFGRFVGALPSGRCAGEPLSNGISPSQAGTKKGTTAIIRSVARVDLTDAANGVNFIMGLDPGVFSTGDGDIFGALVRTYFRLGGMHAQFNVLTEDMLRNAQKDPDRYRWLTVRVAGYSAYFTDLTKDVQEEIIRRVSKY